MTPCPDTGCDDPTFNVADNIGIVLYEGPYDPQFDSSNPPDHKPPYQNFTFPVPTNYAAGQDVVLSVTHLSIVAVCNESVAEHFPLIDEE